MGDKLSAQIDACKFNRRKYPINNDYEFRSPQPTPSKKTGSIFTQPKVERLLATPHSLVTTPQVATPIKTANSSFLNTRLGRTSQNFRPAIAADTRLEAQSYQQIVESIKKISVP